MVRGMQRLTALQPTGERIVMFVPRWLHPSAQAVSLPYRVIPIVSTLLRHGIDVDLWIEPRDGACDESMRTALTGAVAAVAWCAELNPAEQLPSLVAFLQRVASTQPSLPRLLGGGFLVLWRPGFEFEGLCQPITSGEVGALLDALRALRGEPPAGRQPFTVDALYRMDVRAFVQPSSLQFGNDEPALQLPTGLGCGKQCPFCFYEQTDMRVLAAPAMVDLVEHCQRTYGVRQFLLGELDFAAGTKRALDFAAGLRQRNLDVHWFALASVRDILRLGSEGMAQLAASGMVAMETGPETGTDDGLNRIGKKFTVAEAERAHDLIVGAGVTPVYNWMLGWPGETNAHRRGTMALVDRLHGRAKRIVMHFRHYQAMPMTTLGDTVIDLFGPFPGNLTQLQQWRIAQDRQLPWLSPEDEKQVQFLTDYLLPLGYGDDMVPGRPPLMRRVLRRLAKLRCRTGFLRLPVDRKVFQATCERPLRSTWLA